MTGKEEKVTVNLNGGGPWGFRLQGGAGTGLPLIVSKVRRKSKAYRRLREGDRILSVNGRTCEGLTYDQLMDIADKCGTDLKLEVLRRECDKENKVPQPKQTPVLHKRETEQMAETKELKTFTETSTKVSEEKEGLRIKSAAVSTEPKAFESFTSSKLDDRPAATVPEQALEPFPPFKDLQLAPLGDVSTSSKQESVTGDDKSFTKTAVETKHEIKGNTETSYMKKEQESFSKTTSDIHGLPDITMDTIDLNNLISETQKKLDSFKNNFKTDVITDSKHSFKAGEVLENKSNFPSGNLLDSQNIVKTSEVVDNSITEVKKTEIVKSSTSETKMFESANVLKDVSSQKSDLQSTGLQQTVESVVSKQSDPVKKLPPLILPEPKSSCNPGLDAFKDCLKELEMDPMFSLPDLGFTSQSSESSTITTDIPFGTSTAVTKKKKMFSSSSFYEEPDSIYPTMEEQVEMAHKIASSLADDTNRKSKGSNMFYKRVKRSSKWIHEGPDPSDESGSGTPDVQGVEPPTPDPSQVPFKPSKGPTNLRLVLDPRHPLDITSLRSSGQIISEHNVVSPDVCHELVKDLHSPIGKGAALFAKRKQKSEEWVVDEERLKYLLKEQEIRKFQNLPHAVNQYSSLGRQDIKLVKSPWAAAMESPFGLCDSAFSRVNPDHLADTVIKAADQKRAGSLSRESSRMEGCISPPVPPPLTPAAAMYDIYHAKAPKGWPGSTPHVDFSPSAVSTPILAPAQMPMQQTNIQNRFQPKKMVFQNFNTVPRCWKGTSVR